MKKYSYVILLLGSLLWSSCTKSDDNLNNSMGDVPVCIPYLNISFSTTDVTFFVTDENTTIVGHRQEGNCLVLDTRFPGGCEDHILHFLIDENNQSSVNISVAFPARLSHNNTDQCEAVVALEVFVDISNLELIGAESIMLSIENYDQIVEIVF